MDTRRPVMAGRPEVFAKFALFAKRFGRAEYIVHVANSVCAATSSVAGERYVPPSRFPCSRFSASPRCLNFSPSLAPSPAGCTRSALITKCALDARHASRWSNDLNRVKFDEKERRKEKVNKKKRKLFRTEIKIQLGTRGEGGIADLPFETTS